MKCIDKKRRIKLIVCTLLFCTFLTGCSLLESKDVVAEYEAENYNKDIYRSSLFSDKLCVTAENVSTDGAPDTSKLKSAALFDLEEKQVDFAYNVHEKVYPASTTKIMTALVAIKNGDLSDMVTVSANAVNREADESTCELKAGDQLTLGELLNGLLIYSGNDNAVAIAEYIGGTEAGFVEMMNEQARDLMATGTHYMNASGMHNENHYTTAYDLYLIFNECIKYEEFSNIIKTSSYTANIKGADGVVRPSTWKQTNFYATGEVPPPQKGIVIGGKTGTTKAAGNCLILLDEDQNQNPFISIVMGADTKPILYDDMTALINTIS